MNELRKHAIARDRDRDRSTRVASDVLQAATEMEAQSRKRPLEASAEEDASKRRAVEDGRRVFVGHLPQSTTDEAIRSHFGACGSLIEVDMLRRHDASRRFKGSAFITFEKAKHAARALKLDGSEWGHNAEGGAPPKRIVVALAQDPGHRRDGATQREEHGGASSARDGAAPQRGGAARDADGEAGPPTRCASVFVDNLPASSTEKDVRRAFREISGPSTIRKVKLLPVVGDGRRGFVDFVNHAAAAAAAAKSGSTLLGRTLTVAFSRRADAPSGDGRRSRAAKARRRQKREEQRDRSAAKPVLALGSN